MKTILFLLLLSLSVNSSAVLNRKTNSMDSVVHSIDFLFDIARGNVKGYTHVNRFGKTENADSGIPTDVWDGATATVIWVAPTTARVHNISSSSASDDGAPVGVGARTVRVSGLTSWAVKEVSEDVILNGTTDVATVNSYVIINTMMVLTNGATSVNVGDIDATAVTDGTITAQIKAGLGQTQTTVYGIPSVQDGYITKLYAIGKKAGGATKLINTALLCNLHPDVELLNFLSQETGAITGTGGPGFKMLFNPYKRVPGPAILKIQVNSDTADAEISSGFDIILVDNE